MSEQNGHDKPYLIVSGDSHAGPKHEQLREYCPAKYLSAYDEHVKVLQSRPPMHDHKEIFGGADRQRGPRVPDGLTEESVKFAQEQLERIRLNPGSYDPAARLRDMDADGIASEVVIAGAQNGNDLPWLGGFGFDAGSRDVETELRGVGIRLWNSWLADFCATAPERLLGVMQLDIRNVEKAIEEVRWGAEHGLRAINFPAPRADYPAYNEPSYDPFWAAVAEVGLPLVTHSGSGEIGAGFTGRGSVMLWHSEILWFSRRGLSQMIFGGVFDRFPSLTLMFVEQRGNWVQSTLNELDSAFLGVPTNTALPVLGAAIESPKRKPSEYWHENCIVADSFMAPYEAAMRHEIGIETLMWGSDYPHLEGTWPRTKLALRNVFADVPEDDTRAILGGNGARVFNLDMNVLQPVVDRIGPRPSELSRPLASDEFPIYRGLAFREAGSFH